MRWIQSGLIVLSLFFSLTIEAQAQHGPGLQIPPLAQQPSIGSKLLLPDLSTLHTSAPSLEQASKLSFRQAKSKLPSYIIDELALFCRWEALIEKSAKIPVKFRLGDVDTVDRLEGKPHVRY